VGERLLGGDVGELGGGAAAERSAAGGDDEAAHVVAAGGEVALRQAGELVGGQAGEALGDRVVLGVHGHDLSGDGELPDERAADDQRFFVGKGEQPSGAQRSEGGFQAERPGDAVEHHVAVPGGELRDSFGSG